MKKTVFIRALACAVLMIPALVSSKGAFAADIDIHSILSKYGGDAWLHLDYTMDVYWKVREKNQHTEGEIFCAPGNRFAVTLGDTRWVSDGETLWNYRTRTGQVIIRPLSAVDPRTLPAAIISRYTGDLDVTCTPRADTLWVCRAQRVKHADGPDGDTISVGIDPAAGTIRYIRRAAQATTTTYTFTATSFGATFSGDVFTFSPPEDAEVIDER